GHAADQALPGDAHRAAVHVPSVLAVHAPVWVAGVWVEVPGAARPHGLTGAPELHPRMTKTPPNRAGPHTFVLTNETPATARGQRTVGTCNPRRQLPRRIHQHPQVQPRETPAHARTDTQRVGPVPHAAPEPPRHGASAARR